MRDYRVRKIRTRRSAVLWRLCKRKIHPSLIAFIGIRVVFWGCLVILCGLTMHRLFEFAGKSSYLTLPDVRFEGCTYSSPQELMVLAGIKDGTSIFSVNPKHVAQCMMHNPWVRNITVKRSFTQGLSIEVIERKPAALVADTTMLLLDWEGVLFKAVDSDDPVDMPVITSETSIKDKPGMLKEVLAFFISGNESHVLPYESISEIHVDESDGFIVYTVREALCIRVGFGDYRGKLALLAQVQEDLNKRRISPSVIHLLSSEVAHIRKVPVSRKG